MRLSLFTLSFLLLLGFSSCKKDTIDPNLPTMQLSKNEVTDKSGRAIDVTVRIFAPYGVKELQISKGVNLQTDNNYGTNGILTVMPTASGDSAHYEFSYTLSPDEVDKLVGFNFKLVDDKGNTVEKDLTVHTRTSGAQMIFSHKWVLTSKFWESVGAETIEDCEKDNSYQWNRDSSITIAYGTSGCTFDGFNVYDKWWLSDDEKTFKQVYHSLFDPSNVTTETYTVRSISPEKLVMAIDLDLSVFGPPYTDHETFVYTYNAVP